MKTKKTTKTTKKTTRTVDLSPYKHVDAMMKFLGQRRPARHRDIRAEVSSEL
jgi:hypothetical protein